MAGRVMTVVVVILAVAATSFWWGADAQSSSCTSVIASLAPCLSYITGNSTTPSSSCCSQLSNVLNTNAQCLCEVLNGTASSSLGITINQTQALELPKACNLQTPSISRCNASSAVGSPFSSPSSPGVGNIAPSPTSEGNSTTLSFSLLFLLLFIGSSTSSFSFFHAVMDI